jgi:hypothetical protein
MMDQKVDLDRAETLKIDEYPGEYQLYHDTEIGSRHATKISIFEESISRKAKQKCGLGILQSADIREWPQPDAQILNCQYTSEARGCAFLEIAEFDGEIDKEKFRLHDLGTTRVSRECATQKVAQFVVRGYI